MRLVEYLDENYLDINDYIPELLAIERQIISKIRETVKSQLSSRLAPIKAQIESEIQTISPNADINNIPHDLYDRINGLSQVLDIIYRLEKLNSIT